MTEQQVWTPSRRVFIRGALVNAALTFPAFVLLASLTNFPQGQFLVLGIGLPLVLTLIFFLDDALRWRRVRSEQWQITDSSLTHDGPEGTAMIPLNEIDRVYKRIGGTVIVQLQTRHRLAMRYLEAPDDVVMYLDPVHKE